jgi:hypothetical protein
VGGLFIEPVSVPADNGANVYRMVTDSVRVRTYESWLENESAQMALGLYATAWSLTPEALMAKRAAVLIYRLTREGVAL